MRWQKCLRCAWKLRYCRKTDSEKLSIIYFLRHERVQWQYPWYYVIFHRYHRSASRFSWKSDADQVHSLQIRLILRTFWTKYPEMTGLSYSSNPLTGSSNEIVCFCTEVLNKKGKTQLFHNSNHNLFIAKSYFNQTRRKNGLFFKTWNKSWCLVHQINLHAS